MFKGSHRWQMLQEILSCICSLCPSTASSSGGGGGGATFAISEIDAGTSFLSASTAEGGSLSNFRFCQVILSPP